MQNKRNTIDVNVTTLLSPTLSELSDGEVYEQIETPKDPGLNPDTLVDDQKPMTNTEEQMKDRTENPKSKTSLRKKIVKDTYHMAYILFFLLGAGSICPSHAFLMSVDFFKCMFPPHSHYIEYILAFSNNAGQILSITLLLLACKEPTNENTDSDSPRKILDISRIFYWSTFARVMLSWVLNFFALFVTIGMIFLLSKDYVHDQNSTKEIALWIMITCNVLCGIGSGILIASFFSFAALFPWEYTQSVMGGIGMAGALVSLFRVFTKIILNTPGQINEYATYISTLILFIASTFLQLLGILLFWMLVKRPITQFNSEKHIQLKKKRAAEQEALISINNDSNRDLTRPRSSSLFKNASVIEVSRKLLSPGFGVFYTFIITYTLMPGQLSDIKAIDFDSLKVNGWMSITLLTIFSVSDFIGRMLPRWKRTIILAHKQLWIPILLRSGFVILFVLRTQEPSFALGDVWIFILVGLFGLSHGYCAAVDMMIGPELVDQNSRTEREYAGITMTLFLNTGLLVGSSLALVFILLKYY